MASLRAAMRLPARPACYCGLVTFFASISSRPSIPFPRSRENVITPTSSQPPFVSFSNRPPLKLSFTPYFLWPFFLISFSHSLAFSHLIPYLVSFSSALFILAYLKDSPLPPIRSCSLLARSPSSLPSFLFPNSSMTSLTPFLLSPLPFLFSHILPPSCTILSSPSVRSLQSLISSPLPTPPLRLPPLLQC